MKKKKKTSKNFGKGKAENHYYSINPKSKYMGYKVSSVIRNRNFTFLSASGLFSSRKIDLGTKVLIENSKIPEKGTILDLGCGIGVVGIVMASINKGLKVNFVDINKRAIATTKKNISLHNIKNFSVFQGDFPNIIDINSEYDAIYFNPPIRMGQDYCVSKIGYATTLLKLNGSLYIVVKKKLGANSLINKIAAILSGNTDNSKYHISVISKHSGYWVAEIQKK